MFNNCNPKTNGEYLFFEKIKHNINNIFDVGCKYNSEYTEFNGEVHYFDPVSEYIEKLKKIENKNEKSYFNNFGLGDENAQLDYFPMYESFYNRIASCRKNCETTRILTVQTGYEYVKKNNIYSIDFLKIDTEGYEFKVLKGFGDFLENIKIIQFEYGGTFIDNKTKLKDVIDYLRDKGFHKFSYLTNNGHVLINDFSDHYNYCNIVCINKNSSFVPY